MAFDVGSVVAHIKADLSDFSSGVDQAKSEMDSFGEKVGNGIDSIRSGFEKVGLVVAAQTLILKEFGGEAINIASNFEQTQTSFGTLLGSEQKAADLMKQIMQFEQHTPFDIETLTNAAKQMLAFGVNANNVIPIMSRLTDMSQGQSAKLQELVSIYGQVNSIQQLNGREVLRLSSIGVPIYQALEDHFNKMGGAAQTSSVAINAFGETVKKVSKDNTDQLASANVKLKEQNDQLKILEEEHPKAGLATDKHNLAIEKLKDNIAATTTKIGDHTISLKSMGGQSEVTAEQVKKMVEKGEISSKVFNQVLQEMTDKGGLFFQENIRQMSTFSGIMSSTHSQLQYAILNIMGIDIGAANEVRKGGLFDTLRTMAANLLDQLNKLQPVFKAIGENKNFQLAIEGIVVALLSLVVIIPVVLIALNPWILIVVAIEAAVAALFIAWNSNFMGIRNITASVTNEIMNFFNNYLKPAIDLLAKWWSEHWWMMRDILIGAWQIMKGLVETAWAIIYGIIKLGIDLMTGNWLRAWNDVVDIFKGGWKGAEDILRGALNVIKGIGGFILDALTQPFRDAWNQISALMSKIKDAIDFTKRHSPSVIDIIENGVGLANQALGELAFNNTFAVNPSQVFSMATNSAPMYNAINIDMNGAIIADSSSAMDMAEKIGDGIINKLKLNIRF